MLVVLKLWSHRVVVRFNDCDLFGHVNNGAYLTYLEEARRTLWLRQLGYDIGDPRPDESLAGFVLARVEVNYRAPARCGDELEVGVHLTSIGRSSVTYSYDVIATARERSVASATTVVVHFDYAGRRSVAIGDSLRTRLGQPVVS